MLRMRYRYEKLNSIGEKVGRNCWTKKMNGRVKGVRLSRSKKITLKVFSVVVLTSRIVRLYNQVLNQIKSDAVYPNIIFSTQWGLPVLSHSSVKCRPSVVSIYTS
ncbi:hypothetical protein UlMin_015212 [Ulmus minor]